MRRMCVLACCVGVGSATAQDLFGEAGASKGQSPWVNIRLLPLIDIALRGDDVILMHTLSHPADGFAMRIDGEAIAADCKVSEEKDSASTYSSTSDSNKNTLSTTTVTPEYWATCHFPEGTSAKAIAAKEIVVQVSMTNKTTKAHTLKPKELAKFKKIGS